MVGQTVVQASLGKKRDLIFKITGAKKKKAEGVAQVVEFKPHYCPPPPLTVLEARNLK
jgi:hypothetical protein